MDDTYFELAVQNAIEELPEQFREKLENLNIMVASFPTREQQIKSGSRGLLLGLYEGIPHIKRGNYGYGGQLPDKITLFKKNIEYISAVRGHAIHHTIKNVFLHEVAHHFGMSEEEIENVMK